MPILDDTITVDDSNDNDDVDVTDDEYHDAAEPMDDDDFFSQSDIVSRSGIQPLLPDPNKSIVSMIGKYTPLLTQPKTRNVTDHDHCYATSKPPQLVREATTSEDQTESFFVGRCGFKKCKFEATSSESFSQVSSFVTANCSQQHLLYFRLSTHL